MKIITLALTIMVAVMFVGSAMAVPPGKTVDYTGSANGKVVFDGKAHADKGLKCNDCHTKIFQMKKGAKITMAEMNAGKTAVPAITEKRPLSQATRQIARSATRNKQKGK